MYFQFYLHFSPKIYMDIVNLCSMWEMWNERWHYRFSIERHFYIKNKNKKSIFFLSFNSTVVIASKCRQIWMWLLARLHHSIYGYSIQSGRNPGVGIYW